MIRARPAAVLAAAACGLLAGCSAPWAAPAVAPRAMPPTASQSRATAFASEAFSTIVPAGWTSRIHVPSEVQKFSSDGQVEMLIEEGPPGQLKPNINDVTANINVLLIAPAVPDDQVSTYLQSVVDSGATNLSAPRSFTVDGAPGQYVTYDRDISGTPGESKDMVVNHAGGTYDIVLNTSQAAFDQQEQGLEAVLASWRWRA